MLRREDGDVLRREDGHVLRRALDFEIGGQRKREGGLRGNGKRRLTKKV